ncbi:MAG: hypothetical protein GX806_04310 [Lentisphaerae bacterium]|nr:hypothetical protein [Lentisphaerota bacterium]
MTQTMTSRERVQRAITFSKPDRIPLGVMPPGYPTDIFVVRPDADPHWQPRAPNEDEFGCLWTKSPAAPMGQVTFHPLADYAALAEYRFPDYKNPARYQAARAAVRARAGDKFVLAQLPFSLLQRLEYLRGSPAAWMDPYTHPAELRQLLHSLADVAIAALDHFAALGAHGVMAYDDWGLQDRPLLAPAMFIDFWKSEYQRVYQHARRLGLRTFLHSCGHISALLEDFIEAGLEVIQMDQQENMGLDDLARRFGGRLCFWCPVDIQRTMVEGTVAEVRAYARRLMETFGYFDGGFLAQWYTEPQVVQHAEEKIKAMCDEFVEYGGRFYAQR